MINSMTDLRPVVELFSEVGFELPLFLNVVAGMFVVDLTRRTLPISERNEDTE